MDQRAAEIWTGGSILTMDPSNPRAEALAIANGRILAVGTEPEIEALIGPGTRIRRLDGATVLPGFIDAHVHALWGGRRDLFEVFPGYGVSLQTLLQATAQKIAGTKPGRWISGGPWRAEHLDGLGETPRALLDRMAPEHPVALSDVTRHSVWANSLALERAGIDEARFDPPGGGAVRDANGRLTGLLHEAAAGPISECLTLAPEEMALAAGYVTQNYHRLGVTGFKEAMAYEPELAAYAAADRQGRLRLHVTACLTRQSPIGASRTPFDTLAAWRGAYATTHLQTNCAKLFLDGVAPSLTASFLEPYAIEGYDCAAHDYREALAMSPAEIAEEVTTLDRAGFSVKMHAVGDGAARAGLDAIEAARAANGPSGLRHEIAHCTYVNPSDMPRFAALGAVAELSPKLWFPNPATATQIRFLGAERAQRCAPVGSLLAAGAEVVYGSDWPAAAPDADPWIGLAGMLTRRDPTGGYPGTVGPDEAISLDRALPLFTRNGAAALGRGGITGRLAPGYSADFICLDRNLEEIAPEEIAATTVKATLFEGGLVYEA